MPAFRERSREEDAEPHSLAGGLGREERLAQSLEDLGRESRSRGLPRRTSVDPPRGAPGAGCRPAGELASMALRTRKPRACTSPSRGTATRRGTRGSISTSRRSGGSNAMRSRRSPTTASIDARCGTSPSPSTERPLICKTMPRHRSTELRISRASSDHRALRAAVRVRARWPPPRWSTAACRARGPPPPRAC